MRSEELKKLGGRTFANRYDIMNLLGSGGMGSVFIAKDRQNSNQLVAMKILHRQLTGNPEFVERFLREIDAIGSVDHPNVIRSFDSGEFEGAHYYTMEVLRGSPLSELISEYGAHNPLPWEKVESIIAQILCGLAAIHEANLIHRDLKPDNVFLEDEDVIKITDFGVVRVQNSSLTQTDAIIGTLHYVAPEIWMGEPPSPQSDLYALGILVYELLTGDLPFPANSPAELMRAHLTGTPEPILAKRPDIPDWVELLVGKMLAKSPEERAASAESLLEMLQSPPNGMPGTSRAPTAPTLKISKKDSKTVDLTPDEEPVITAKKSKTFFNLSEALKKEIATPITDHDPLDKLLHNPDRQQQPAVNPQAFTSSNSLKKVGLDPSTPKPKRSVSMIMAKRAFGKVISEEEEEVLRERRDDPQPSVKNSSSDSLRMMLRADRNAEIANIHTYAAPHYTPSGSSHRTYGGSSSRWDTHPSSNRTPALLVFVGIVCLLVFLAFPQISTWMAKVQAPTTRTQVGP